MLTVLLLVSCGLLQAGPAVDPDGDTADTGCDPIGPLSESSRAKTWADVVEEQGDACFSTWTCPDHPEAVAALERWDYETADSWYFGPDGHLVATHRPSDIMMPCWDTRWWAGTMIGGCIGERVLSRGCAIPRWTPEEHDFVFDGGSPRVTPARTWDEVRLLMPTECFGVGSCDLEDRSLNIVTVKDTPGQHYDLYDADSGVFVSTATGGTRVNWYGEVVEDCLETAEFTPTSSCGVAEFPE